VEQEEIREIIKRELPTIVREDPEIQELVFRLSEDRFADRRATESRFDRILDELRRDREEQRSRWADQNREWDEQNRRWDEQNRRWDKNQVAIDKMLASIEALNRKHDSALGALGARWGLHAEESFRSGLREILEQHFDVRVVNVREFDDEGEVFGRPDQIELDVVVKDGILIICEIKSSLSKSDVHVFDRKVKYYEKRHNKKATEVLLISPMVDDRARALAEKLGIKVHTYPDQIDPDIFS